MEQRAHIRHAVDMPARISAGGFHERACEIRDFCLGGMLLSVPDDESGLMTALESGDPVTLAVEVDGVRGRRTLRLPGRVARRDGAGLGVAFAGPDPTDLLAMQNHVRRLLDQAEPRAAGNTPRDLQRARQAARGVLRIQQHFCVSGMEAFFPAVRDALEAAGDPGRQSAEVLADKEKQLIQEFVRRASMPLESIAEGHAPQEQATEFTTPQSPEDSAAFQEWLALRVMASRTELRFNQELLSLQLRFDELFDISLNPRRNPLAPSVLCTAFGEALGNLPLHRKSHQVILDTFEQTLLARVGELYETINGALSRAGVLPDLDVSRYISENY